jgi:hypothetical protein
MALSPDSVGGVDISFVDYLASLPAAKVDALYGSRWTCAALLRALPPLGKQCVLRMLHLDAPLSLGAWGGRLRSAAAPPSVWAACRCVPLRAHR